MAGQYFSIHWDQYDKNGENPKRKSASRSSRKSLDAFVAKLEASGTASRIETSEMKNGRFTVL